MANTTDPSAPDAFAAQVTEWYQQFLHRDPSPAEIEVHRNNPGGLDGVYGAIAQSKEATNYTAPAAASAGAGTSGRDRAAAYYTSKGVTPFPTSLDYWDSKWNDWGKTDPTYFDQRVAQADEFTGVGPNYNWQAAGGKDPGTSAAASKAAGRSMLAPTLADLTPAGTPAQQPTPTTGVPPATTPTAPQVSQAYNGLTLNDLMRQAQYAAPR